MKRLLNIFIGTKRSDEEFNPESTLNKVRFGDTIDNTDVLKEIVFFIKLAEKLFDTSYKMDERAYIAHIADRINPDTKAQISKLVKDKRDVKLKTGKLSSNFQTLEELYSVLDLYSAERKAKKIDFLHFVPPNAFALVNSIKKQDANKDTLTATDVDETSNGPKTKKGKKPTNRLKSAGSTKTSTTCAIIVSQNSVNDD